MRYSASVSVIAMLRQLTRPYMDKVETPGEYLKASGGSLTLHDRGHMHLIRVTFLIAVILSAAHAVGQDAISPKLDATNGDDAAYSNECLGLEYRLTDGWKFARITQARTGQPNQKMILFRVKRNSAAASAESLELDVLQTPTLKHPNMERFTILLALSFVHVDSANNKITRDAYPVTIAGRSFFRSDLRSGGKALSLFATWYRGYAVVAWASADSPEDLEDTANALRALSFGEDKRTAECFDSTN
jgi:hypothetical protein